MISTSGIGERFFLSLAIYCIDVDDERQYYILACVSRVVVQGEGPGPRYGHVMDLVSQRYLVTVTGNDGKDLLSDFSLALLHNFCFPL